MVPFATVVDAVKAIKEIKSGFAVVPIGGCGEFGLNMTLYCLRDEYYVVDCGLMFPDSTKLGVDAIIPDLDEIFSELGAPKAYLITHGHEDHIGALPYILRRWSAPLYCTAWTAELIKEKFLRGNLDAPTMTVVRPKDRLSLGSITCDWVHVNHSIPMCCSLILRHKNQTIVHTGDFKFEDDSMYEPALKESDFSDLLPNGCDLLVADSTNASSKGPCPSETICYENFQTLLKEVPGNIYVTTFASNLWRILSIIKAAKEAGRSVHFAGRGLEKTASIARTLSMFPSQLNNLVDAGMVAISANENRVIICTGCQGEPMSALARIVRGEHPNLKLSAHDTVVFSSRMIPGSERQVFHMMSECARKGVQVYSVKNQPNIHVSGHAYQGDLGRLVKAARPKHVMAVHGTFSQLQDHVDFHASTQLSVDQVTVGEDGTVYRLAEDSYKAVCQFDVNWLYIDGFAKSPISSTNLKQRLRIGELGLVIFSAVFNHKTGDWLGEVFLDIKGLELPARIDPDSWYDSCKLKALRCIEQALSKGVEAAAEINEAVRIGLRQHFASVFHKKVVVTASVHEVKV